jgi:hypothetical protein
MVTATRIDEHSTCRYCDGTIQEIKIFSRLPGVAPIGTGKYECQDCEAVFTTLKSIRQAYAH